MTIASPTVSASTMLAIGLMSGTSLDGIDVSAIETDGISIHKRYEGLTVPYLAEFQARLFEAAKTHQASPALIQELTDLHAEAVELYLSRLKLDRRKVDIVGFHGHTIEHRPRDRVTVQIGDGARLAKQLGIAVVGQFRIADVEAGGQGAPLVPLYHRAIMREQKKPVALVNIGGVSNVTLMADEREESLVAGDLGPGNAFSDDLSKRFFNKPFDEAGELASLGKVNTELLARWLRHPFFEKPFPKSLDRFSFWQMLEPDVADLEPLDAIATLTAFTAASICEGIRRCASHPHAIYICGGGRLNDTLMQMIRSGLDGIAVQPIDTLGYSGDSIEAEAFAFLAVRSRKGMNLTLPGTTGVPQAWPGGVFYPS